MAKRPTTPTDEDKGILPPIDGKPPEVEKPDEPIGDGDGKPPGILDGDGKPPELPEGAPEPDNTLPGTPGGLDEKPPPGTVPPLGEGPPEPPLYGDSLPEGETDLGAYVLGVTGAY